jgi:hypothetical protein
MAKPSRAHFGITCSSVARPDVAGQNTHGLMTSLSVRHHLTSQPIYSYLPDAGARRLGAIQSLAQVAPFGEQLEDTMRTSGGLAARFAPLSYQIRIMSAVDRTNGQVAP